MPWTFDTLLPAAERYASLKFRRVSRRFDASRLDYAEAVELVAIGRTLGEVMAAKIFGWDVEGRAEYKRLAAGFADNEDVALAVEQNREGYSRAEGLRVLEVMKESGWKQGYTPEIVRLALLDMRAAGLSQPKIAAALGLTLDQVRVMANGPRRPRATVSLADAALVAQ